jgi:hypothetical protein
MKMTAAEAGRKGGQSRSARKLAAIKKNGFQPCKPVEVDAQKATNFVAPKPVSVLTVQKTEE